MLSTACLLLRFMLFGSRCWLGASCSHAVPFSPSLLDKNTRMLVRWRENRTKEQTCDKSHSHSCWGKNSSPQGEEGESPGPQVLHAIAASTQAPGHTALGSTQHCDGSTALRSCSHSKQLHNIHTYTHTLNNINRPQHAHGVAGTGACPTAHTLLLLPLLACCCRSRLCCLLVSNVLVVLAGPDNGLLLLQHQHSISGKQAP